MINALLGLKSPNSNPLTAGAGAGAGAVTFPLTPIAQRLLATIPLHSGAGPCIICMVRLDFWRGCSLSTRMTAAMQPPNFLPLDLITTESTVLYSYSTRTLLVLYTTLLYLIHSPVSNHSSIYLSSFTTFFCTYIHLFHTYIVHTFIFIIRALSLHCRSLSDI